ncbi:hypothetical protein CKCBHOJB_02212 [Thauera sp. GDN1]|uniref:prepilin-type N-terminal cleavage/methylation domain-containing protein n=1 Tax=Thauera sp. GDN1 TaxID=2944810 RepID=UPI00247A45D5|nr:prepilin-type N-terminal cleavage/methylation domain-containing protein [Thauera sp. GDN1]WEN42613.1 hypothetical protein CKCBHOJB_02212 [Thauera sp. GDN1]
MNKKKNASGQYGKGFTLVELMVGMVVSMVVVLGMVGVYQTVSRNASEVSLGTKIDSQIFSGMLTVDRILQGAGFGVLNGPPDFPNAYGAVFVAYTEDLSEYVLGSTAAARSIVWSAVGGGCNALVSDASGLRYFGPDGYSCSNLSMPGVGVPSTSLVQRLSAVGFENVGVFEFRVRNEPCSPFAIDAPTVVEGSYIIEILATVFGGDRAAGNVVRNQVCLINYK